MSRSRFSAEISREKRPVVTLGISTRAAVGEDTHCIYVSERVCEKRARDETNIPGDTRCGADGFVYRVREYETVWEYVIGLRVVIDIIF